MGEIGKRGWKVLIISPGVVKGYSPILRYLNGEGSYGAPGV